MTTVTATRMLGNGLNSLDVEWWIGSFMQDLIDGKELFSDPFPKESINSQFRLKLRITGSNLYLVQLSFCVWKADFTRESAKVPSSVTLNVPPTEEMYIGTSTVELPHVKTVDVSYTDPPGNTWLLVRQYSLVDNSSARSASSLHIRLTLQYPEAEGMREESLVQLLTVCDFKTLLEDDTYVDLTVTASDGVTRKAHKTVLVARSKVFHAMFKHDMIEGQSSELHLEDVSGEVMDDFLKYLYLGYVPNMEVSDSKALLALSDKYELSALKLISQEHLYKQLNVENAVDTLAVAILHDATILKKFTLIFITEHGIGKIMKTEGWRSLNNVAAEILSAILEFIYCK